MYKIIGYTALAFVVIVNFVLGYKMSNIEFLSTVTETNHFWFDWLMRFRSLISLTGLFGFLVGLFAFIYARNNPEKKISNWFKWLLIYGIAIFITNYIVNNYLFHRDI
jgi:hypothetical protein